LFQAQKIALPALRALTVVVPTFEERENIRPLVSKLEIALSGIDWEVVFVDDDSQDGTAQEIAAVALANQQVRLLHRKGRRGLSSACVEGILSSVSPIVAVMDADLQHDETLLGRMFLTLQTDLDVSLVIGSRNVAGGSAGRGLSALRKWGSDRANGLARRTLGIAVSDPMSGFFMLRRAAFNEVATELQSQGFKILADILSASQGRWRVVELPYSFRARRFGASKLGGAVTLEFLGLLVARLTGGLVPIRFVLFAMVGLTGVIVQLAVVRLALTAMGHDFALAQTIGVLAAMTTNFDLNNRFTYRDRALRGRAFLKGLLTFYMVCSVGALANIAAANALFSVTRVWEIASVFGALVGAVWNFWASLTTTWKAR